MKNILIGLAIFFGTLGFIIALQNVGISAPVQVFFQTATGTLFSPLILIQILGILSGFFLGVAIMIKKKKEIRDVSDL